MFVAPKRIAIDYQRSLTTISSLGDRTIFGTKQSVIARLEDAEYEGHSLSMLQKIACALNQKLEVHLIPIAPDEHQTEQRSA